MASDEKANLRNNIEALRQTLVKVHRALKRDETEGRDRLADKMANDFRNLMVAVEEQEMPT